MSDRQVSAMMAELSLLHRGWGHTAANSPTIHADGRDCRGGYWLGEQAGPAEERQLRAEIDAARDRKTKPLFPETA